MASAPASSSAPQDEYELDPVFVNSRREAIFIFSLWFMCLLWAVPVCYVLGYNEPVTPETVPLVMGIPRWTFWGIVFPWLLADVVTLWFCFRFLKDDPLDAPGNGPEGESSSPEADGGDA